MTKVIMGGIKVQHDAQCDTGSLPQIIKCWEPIVDVKKFADTDVSDAAKRTTHAAALYEFSFLH